MRKCGLSALRLPEKASGCSDIDWHNRPTRIQNNSQTEQRSCTQPPEFSITGASDVMFETQVDILLGHGNSTFAAAAQTLIAGGIADPSPAISAAFFSARAPALCQRRSTCRCSLPFFRLRHVRRT
jgi:hypothetical protein